MLSKEILDLLNFQINREFYSAYLYRAIANYFEWQGFSGFSHWYNIQATEEKEHSILMMQYVLDCGERVKLSPVEAPEDDFSDFRGPVSAALEHEQLVTSYIHKIYQQALLENDYRTMKFLDFFVVEQGEEEKNAQDILRQLELIGDSKQGLFMLDAQLKNRPYNPMPGIRSGVVN